MGIFSLLLKFQQMVSELALEAELQFGLVAPNNSESIWAGFKKKKFTYGTSLLVQWLGC